MTTDIMNPPISSEEFKIGMRRLAAGVSLITTRHDGVAYGLIATSVTSVSADPPTLLVCINSNASAHDPLLSAGVFCVNVLGRDGEEAAAIFSSSSRRDERFRTGEWTSLATGSPVLEGVLAAFDCTIQQSITQGSHTIIFGTIVNVRVSTAEIAPLIYIDGTYRELAASAGQRA